MEIKFRFQVTSVQEYKVNYNNKISLKVLLSMSGCEGVYYLICGSVF